MLPYKSIYINLKSSFIFSDICLRFQKGISQMAPLSPGLRDVTERGRHIHNTGIWRAYDIRLSGSRHPEAASSGFFKDNSLSGSYLSLLAGWGGAALLQEQRGDRAAIGLCRMLVSGNLHTLTLLQQQLTNSRATNCYDLHMPIMH